MVEQQRKPRGNRPPNRKQRGEASSKTGERFSGGKRRIPVQPAGMLRLFGIARIYSPTGRSQYALRREAEHRLETLEGSEHISTEIGTESWLGAKKNGGPQTVRKKKKRNSNESTGMESQDLKPYMSNEKKKQNRKEGFQEKPQVRGRL